MTETPPAPPSPRPSPVPCSTVVAFDFDTKAERSIPLREAGAAIEAGQFLWIDIDTDDSAAARRDLESLEISPSEIVDRALEGAAATLHARYEHCLHLVVSGCRFVDSRFELERVDVIIERQRFITIHRGPIFFLREMRREYKADFVQHAKTASFLVYELWDHLLENYQDTQRRIEDRVEELQSLLIAAVDDRVISSVSILGSDLLRFRKVLLPARSILTELATRKSLFVSESTQPFLANMAGGVEHLLHDLLVDRDILSDTLNLHMSLIAHRTNAVVQRLTVVSILFLPLTFLCGVYGMNFANLPETRWTYGYVFFWVAVVVVTVIQVIVLRRKKLL